jgi:CRISPR-associated endonuclease/helicase Cas3
MPRLTASPDAKWYASVFPKGAFVYPHHGELWLTAWLLSERKRITMPDDARLLIEGVFGEKAKKEIPQSLIVQEGKADGGDMSSTAVASLNILHFDDGYKSTTNQWETDARVPTRLGEARVTVLLLRWDGENLSFWSTRPEFADEMSQVSIAEHKLSSAGIYGGKLGRALEVFRMTLRDEGKWRILIPLTKAGGIWLGEGLDNKNKPVTVRYDSVTGLAISKGND